MHKRLALIGVLAPLSLVAAASTGLPQTAQQATPAAPPNAANNAAAPYTMTMGDLMNTLVQPRHAKLGLAGRAQNWPLAAYALAEIDQAFAGIVKAQPRFGGLPVAELVDAAVGPPMSAVRAAIQQQDAKKFAAAYDQLTQGCNACHAAVEHPFVVIKAPDASAFPNQDFNARP
jgi:hypothetical protein